MLSCVVFIFSIFYLPVLNLFNFTFEIQIIRILIIFIKIRNNLCNVLIKKLVLWNCFKVIKVLIDINISLIIISFSFIFLGNILIIFQQFSIKLFRYHFINLFNHFFSWHLLIFLDNFLNNILQWLRIFVLLGYLVKNKNFIHFS